MNPKKRQTRPAPPAAVDQKPKASHAAQAAKRRILVVEDHPMTREGLAATINRQTDLEICGEAGSPAEAMDALARCEPDLMITDMTMPGRSGLEFLKDVHAMKPGLPILVLSMHDEMLFAERALRAGARGYVMKDAGSAKLVEIIRLVLSGQCHVSPAMSGRLIEAAAGHRPRNSHSPIESLSDREFQVFQLLGGGQSTKAVAAALHLSPKTVDVHRGNIKAKLQIKDAPSLIQHAVRWVESQRS